MSWWHRIVAALGGSPERHAPPAERACPGTPNATASAVARAEGRPEDPDDHDIETTDQPWWRPTDAARTRLFDPGPPVMDEDARSLELALNAQLSGQDLNLPPAPRVVERVLGLLHGPDCEFEDLARLVAEDQLVSGTVLRIANSPLYRGNDRITALKPALTRLGLGSIRTLMLHESLRAAMFPGGAADRALARMLWDRSLASGCIMRRLSSVTGTNEENSFLIGLLQDVGNVVVLREAHRQQALTHRHVQLEAFEHLCLRYHQVFGRALAEYWQLPPEVKDLIGDHHDYPAADDPLRTQRWQMQLCEMIRAMLGYGPEVQYDLVNSAPARALGLDGREDFPKLLDDLPAHLDEAMQWYAD